MIVPSSEYIDFIIRETIRLLKKNNVYTWEGIFVENVPPVDPFAIENMTKRDFSLYVLGRYAWD